MPNHLVMEALNLYTAERGVVRDKNTNAIVARNFSVGRMNGLAMRKDYLDKYLSEKKTGFSILFARRKVCNPKRNLSKHRTSL